MRTGEVFSEGLGHLRLDAKFHLDEGQIAFDRVMSGRWKLTTPANEFGEGAIWSPNRFARVYAESRKHGKPILLPYDVFRFLPSSENYLSRSQVAVYDDLRLSRGWLLMTCSGRNLGPVAFVDRYCEQFVLSHDMIRVAAPLDSKLLYFAAFLLTSVGQALVRRDNHGSVIDHISPPHVAAMRYPLVESGLRLKVVGLLRKGFKRREKAREVLQETKAAFLDASGLGPGRMRLHKADRARRFSIELSALDDRIDAEPHAPLYSAYRRRVLRKANGVPLSDIAHVFKPPGRYKTLYVDDAEYGVPLMSGRHISQYLPIGMKYMSPAAFSEPERYCIKAGTVLLTADGRAEKNLADTVLITSDRSGWMASGHVHRLLPRQGVKPGLVYLAASCDPVQAQLKALATGSVVDALSESDVGSVLVPIPDDIDVLAKDASRAWALFSKAKEAEEEAIELLEAELLG